MCLVSKFGSIPIPAHSSSKFICLVGSAVFTDISISNRTEDPSNIQIQERKQVITAKVEMFKLH